MKFYSITWCDCEGAFRSRLFTNKREAQKEHGALKRLEKNIFDVENVTYLSDVETHHVERLTKQSVVKLFGEAQ